MAQAQVFGLLVKTLSADPSERGEAEAQLATLQQHNAATLGSALCAILCARELDAGVRQAGGLALKRALKTPEFWELLGEDGRNNAKQHCLQCALHEPASKIRTAGSLCVAAIQGQHDAWPELFGLLVSALHSANMEEVHGALRCMALVSEDVNEDQLPQVVPVLLPALLSIMHSPAAPREMQRKALAILHGIVSTLAMMSGAFQRQVRDLMVPLVEAWMPALAAVLAAELTLQDPSLWGLKMESLKVLVQLVACFSKPLAQHLPGLMAQCWAMFSRSLQVYQVGLVSEGADEYDTEVTDEEGGAISLEGLLAQMFELLMTLVGNKRFQPQLRAVLPDMAYMTIGYMQMTAQQAESWADNPNTYVADDEEEMFTARVSGELLLGELGETFSKDCTAAVVSAVERRIAESRQACGNGEREWWKMREAAVFALGGFHEHLEAAAKGEARALRRATAGESPRGLAATAALVPGGVSARVQAILQDLLDRDLQGVNLNPFLAGRALWAGAKLAPFLQPQQVEAFLQCAVEGICSESMPVPVRIGACRALVRFAPMLPHSMLAPKLLLVYQGLTNLMAASSELTLHLVLETLTAVVRSDQGVVQQCLERVSLPVLQCWASNVADPLLGEAALETLGQLARNRACLAPLTLQVLPTLSSIIAQPGNAAPMMVEGSLDFMKLLVQPGVPEVVRAVWTQAGGQLLGILSQRDDAGELQGACQLLAELIRAGGPDLLAWGPVEGNPQASLKALLDVLSRLLQPAFGESESAFVGTVLLEALCCWPQLMEGYSEMVLDAVVAKLMRSNMVHLVTGLLLVLAKLTHALGAPKMVDLLAQRSAAREGRQCSALEAVMDLWLDRALDVQGGGYCAALSATALAMLLESRSPALAAVTLKGKRLDLDSGIQTRAAARAARASGQPQQQYTRVAAPSKVVSVLASLLAEEQDPQKPWETLDGSGGETDDEDDEEEEEEEEEVVEGPGAAGERDALGVRGAPFGAAQQHLLEAALAHAAEAGAGEEATAMMGVEDGSDVDRARRRQQDPLATLNLESYLIDLFRRLDMQPDGRQLLQDAREHAMGRRAAHALERLHQQSRLRA